jgi:hypothetical protein
MHKNYSLRVLVIIGALIVSGVYLLIIHFPLQEQLTQIEEESATIAAQYDEETTRLMLRNTMQTAVNEVTEAANGRPIPLPEYDNRAIVMTELNDILEQTASYSLDMQETESGTLHMRRDVSLSYTVPTMTDALVIIGAIRTSPNKYIVTDLTITNGARDGEGSVSVSLKFTAFEYRKPASEPPIE